MAPQLISFFQAQEVQMDLSIRPSNILWYGQNGGVNITHLKNRGLSALTKSSPKESIT